MTITAKLSRLISREKVNNWWFQHTGYDTGPDVLIRKEDADPEWDPPIHVIDAAYVEKLERIINAVGPLVEALDGAVNRLKYIEEHGVDFFKRFGKDPGRYESDISIGEGLAAMEDFTAAVTREVGDET